jgi:septal ring factor EnvC (AmiA/AmiB activator)
MALAGLLVVAMGPVAAEDLEDDLASVTSRITRISSEIQSYQEDRSGLSADIVGTTSRMEALLDDLATARTNVFAVQAEIDDRRDHLADVQDDLQRQYERLEETRLRLSTDRDLAVAFVRERYMTAGNGLAELAFSSDDFMSMALSLEYIGLAAEQSEASISRLEALQKQEIRERELIEAQEEQVEIELALLGLREARLSDLRDEIASDTASVEAELAVQRGLLSELDAQLAFFDGELASLESEQSEIEDLIRDRQSETAASTASAATSGGFVRPVPGRITSGFGPRLHPILGTTRVHTGVDMTAGYGTPIKAADSGKVIYAGYRGGYGNTIIVDHGGGITTLYAHQSNLAASNGDRVDAGEVVGYVGSTGLSTGPHLHFEVRVNGSPVDPAGYL